MSNKAFVASCSEGGRHHELARLAGTWEGRSRVWFEADKLADDSPIRGTIRVALGGRFVIHEYKTAFGGEPQQGIAIHGYHLDRRRYETAWVDSFHTGTSIMQSNGEPDGTTHRVLGHYGEPAGGPEWAWRTELDHPDEEHLTITAWNVAPDGSESKAVEIAYTRRRELE